MTGYIQIPPSVFEVVRTALLRGVLVSLIAKADENGNVFISIRSFANEIGISYQTLRTAINKLSANAIINAKSTQESTQRITRLTICNYADYIRLSEVRQRKQQRKVNATANATETSTKPIRFIPPTDEEVTAYVKEKGYHFNPASFVPHYQSKGWKVGDQPMKDWRAACRTWEVGWKAKYGDKYYYEIAPSTGKNNRDTYYSEDFRQHIAQRLSTPDAPEPDISGYY